jgi:ABC-2 type transport system permease protein
MNRRHAFLQMILARVREFFREPVVLFWVYGFPLILATVLGIAFSQSEPTPPTVDIQGQTDEPRAAEIVATLKDAGLTVTLASPEQSRQRLEKGKTDLIIVLQPNELQYVHGPARDKSRQARNWVDSILTRKHLQVFARKHGVSDDFPVKDVSLSEPGNGYIDFLLPGLIGINIMGGGLFGVGFVLVDMRVRKLFKRLMATPMHRGDFLFAILTARMFFLLPEMLVLLLVGRLAFGVPIKGSLFLLLLVILAGAFAFAGIGLLFGCRTEKTETASGLINSVMLPMYLLSGVFFSSERFPDEIQPLIQMLPLTALNDALREVMLEGGGLAEVAGHLVLLAAWALITFTLALRWFRWK